MKKKKLDLNALQVKSFVTSMENDSKNTIEGGARAAYTEKIVCTASGVCVCPSEVCETQLSCDVTNDCFFVPWNF